jgi:hypothetical protein
VLRRQDAVDAKAAIATERAMTLTPATAAASSYSSPGVGSSGLSLIIVHSIISP